jgi:putative heme iron utilization protein
MTETFTDHAYTGPAPKPFATVTAPSHAAQARTLGAAHDLGTLATVRPDGHPFLSTVQYVLDDHGHPITLISELAEHTKNARNDARASVMVSSTVRPGDDPMALPRVTLLGVLDVVPPGERDEVAGRFVDAHPTTAAYIDFADFGLWRLEISAVRFVGGYGRMSWVPVDDYRATPPDPLARHAGGIVAHMNDDHADACLVYVRHDAGFASATSARMIGVDEHGMDFVAMTPDGIQPARVNFDEPQTTPEGVRRAVVAMLRRVQGEGAHA